MLLELSDIRSMDVVLPTRSGVEIRTRCVSKPTDHQQILLEKLRLKLPAKIIQKHVTKPGQAPSPNSVCRVFRFKTGASPGFVRRSKYSTNSSFICRKSVRHHVIEWWEI